MIAAVRKAEREDPLVDSETGQPISPSLALRLARTRAGLTQVQLAELSGIAQSHVSAIENERETLTIERARKLAAALKVHPRVLVFPEDGEACELCGRK